MVEDSEDELATVTVNTNQISSRYRVLSIADLNGASKWDMAAFYVESIYDLPDLSMASIP